MERGTTKTRETNPRENASFLSVITFLYNYKILKKGRKHDLESRDIYKVLPQFEANKLGDKLQNEWQKDRKKRNKLWITVTKTFGLTYLMYTIIQLAFGTTIIIFQPYVFSKFVAYFQPNQTAITTFDAYLYSSAIGGILFVNILFSHNFAQLVTEYSLKIRTAVCSLIFRKAMKISPMAFSDITIGKAITLMSKDIFAIDAALTFLKDMVIGFLQLIVVTYILYQRVGYSAFPPIAVIILIIPIQLFIGRAASNMRLKIAKRTDERFRLTQEMLSAIKTIKMYTWQRHFEKSLGLARLLETKKLAMVYYLKALIGWLGAFTINISFYILLISYITQGYILHAEMVYFIQQCLFTLRTAITVSIPMGICNTADLLAAFKRIQSFLDAEEIIPVQQSINSPPRVYINNIKVAIKNKEVLKSVSIFMESGLLLVSGSLGSGKSILLKTILGEYPVISGQKEVIGSISYCPEEPWIFPSTIRQNILFGAPYDHQRYQEVLWVCALYHDLGTMENFDETIIGDKGINLSRGQQTRICLARAIYRETDIYLLDDCLSALDINISDHIFQHCIKRFLKNKICIFVTNKIHMITQMSNNNIIFLENGSTLTLEQQNGALDKRITYYIDEEINAQVKEERKSVISSYEKYLLNDNSEDTNEGEGLLSEQNNEPRKKDIYEERKRDGSVQWTNYFTYFKLMGGCLVLGYLTVTFAASQSALSYSEKVISVWVNLEPRIATLQMNNQTTSSEYEEAMTNRTHYVKLYTILITTSMILSLVRSYSTFYWCLRAAKSLHSVVVSALLRAKMSFYDKHLIGNIINRLSKDIYVIDEYMPFLIFDFLRLIFSFIGIIVLVASVNWLLLIPGVLLIIKLYFLLRFYLPTGRSLRRLEASSRSPIVGYLNSTLEGLSIIRTCQQEHKLQMEFDSHQDSYISTYYMNQTTTRFFVFLLDILGVFFVMGIMVKLILFMEGETAGDAGLVISQAMMLSGILQYATKQIAELETVMTSVERVLEYAGTEPEKQTGKSLTGWPNKGSIELKNVSLNYGTETVQALNNICCVIDGGTKVGIIGRTGAGKSSIISTLFRLYDYDGSIAIDNENISQFSVDFLRSNITIIPRDPVLFSGTIRTNIDPFGRFPDDDIWRALEMLHIKNLVFNLDQNVSDSKTTYSSGEKQLLCLARALIQQNKIILLDDATANLDPDMDLLLHKAILECFRNCTVIIIAHKMHSVIWCDKILALKDGRAIEYDGPNVLLKNKNGILCKMLREENFEAFVRITHT